MGRKALGHQSLFDKTVHVVQLPFQMSRKLADPAKRLTKSFSEPILGQPHVAMINAVTRDRVRVGAMLVTELWLLVRVWRDVNAALLLPPVVGEVLGAQ